MTLRTRCGTAVGVGALGKLGSLSLRAAVDVVVDGAAAADDAAERAVAADGDLAATAAALDEAVHHAYRHRQQDADQSPW